MECINHVGKNAVMQCQSCGSFICSDCACESERNLCRSCEVNSFAQHRDSSIRSLVVAGAIFVLMFIVISNPETSFVTRLSGAYVLSSIIYGWSAISNYEKMKAMNFNKVYVFPKCIIAILIGWLVLPYKVYKDLKVIL